MTPSDPSAIEPPPDATPRRRSRILPRFGLRSALIFAILFCLPFACIGRNLYRMRHDDAAIETLKRSNAMVLMQEGDGDRRHPALPKPAYYVGPGLQPARPQEPNLQALGWEARSPIGHVILDSRGVDGAKLQASLAALKRFQEIESVTLKDRGFDNATLLILKELPNLQSISLDGTQVTGEGLAELGPPLRIRTIFVSGGKGADLLPGLSTLTELKSVTFHAVRWKRADLEAVAALPHLEELRLRYGRTAAADDFRPLANAKRLRSLEIEEVFSARFLEDDLKAICSVPSLETLSLIGIDDDGVALLGPLPKLKLIRFEAPATIEAARSFSAAHPNCLVRFRDDRNLPHYYRADTPVDPKTVDAAASSVR